MNYYGQSYMNDINNAGYVPNPYMSANGMNNSNYMYPSYMNYMQQQVPQQNTQQIQQQNNVNNQNVQNQESIQTNANRQMPMLQGKVVENKDIVGITEIPVNTWAVFPKCDFSEVYIKIWKDGQPSVTQRYVLTNDNVGEESTSNTNSTNEILENIQVLSNGITNVNDVISTLKINLIFLIVT